MTDGCGFGCAFVGCDKMTKQITKNENRTNQKISPSLVMISILLLSFSLSNPFPCFASDCDSFLTQVERVQGSPKSFKSLLYIQTKWPEVLISSVVQHESDVAIGFDGGHTTLYYKNYRIDSDGQVGFKVRSFLRKSRTFLGEVLVVIHDPPTSLTDYLDNQIESFKSVQRRTCSLVTCHYLQESFLKRRAHMRPSALLKELIKPKSDLNKTIVVLHDLDLKKVLRIYQRTEAALISAGLLAGAIPMGVLLSPIYFLL